MLAQGRPKAEVTPLVDADGVHAGSTVRVALQVALPDGLHVQSDKPRDPMLIPTVLTIEPPAGVTVSEIAYPEPTDFAQAGQKEPLAVFEQRFVVGAKLTLDAHARRRRSHRAGALPLPGVRRVDLLRAGARRDAVDARGRSGRDAGVGRASARCSTSSDSAGEVNFR